MLGSEVGRDRWARRDLPETTVLRTARPLVAPYLLKRPRRANSHQPGVPVTLSIMSDSVWILGVRLAGGFHFVTLIAACFTPIPPDWDKNLATLPAIHRRFAIAQNISIGAVIAVLGLFSLGFAGELVGGSPLARAMCGATALFWGGRAAVLPWLGVRPTLTTPLLRIGFSLLIAECVIYAAAYGWLAIRPSIA